MNVTNNAGRQNYASHQTSSESHVSVETNYVQGVAAATFDREGHLLLLMVNSERSLVASTAFGVNLAGGSTSKTGLAVSLVLTATSSPCAVPLAKPVPESARRSEGSRPTPSLRFIESLVMMPGVPRHYFRAESPCWPGLRIAIGK